MNKSIIKYFLYKALPLNLYLKFIYKWHHGEKLNISNPQRYTEKLFYLKKYNGLPQNVKLIQEVYDKYRARDYIARKGYKDYLPEVMNVYKSSEDIDFSELPEKYVLKISQSNGYNFINNGIGDIDENDVRSQISEWFSATKDMKQMEKRFKEESYYFDGNPVIMCEEYLCKADGNACDEYMAFCFNGEPKLISLDTDPVDEFGKRKKVYSRNTYDENWNFVPVNMGRPYDTADIIKEKPLFIDKILEISRALASEFVFCRVDFYANEKNLYIGEITFIPQGAAQKITPEEYEHKLGEWINIPRL